MPSTHFNSFNEENVSPVTVANAVPATQSADNSSPNLAVQQRKSVGQLSFVEVNEAALACLEEVLDALDLFAEGKQVGKQYQMLNPKRNDCGLGSFSIDTTTGVWADFAEDDARGGDVVSLVAYILDKSQVEAKNLLAKELGLTKPSQPAQARAVKKESDQTCIMPIPDAMANAVLVKTTGPNINHGKWGGVAISSIKPYAYRNANGQINSFILRYNLANGKKEPRPYSCWQQGGQQPKMKFGAPAKPYSLYNLDQLVARPDAPVLVTEGEKSADAASILFPDHVVVTTMFGAQSPLNSDLGPLVGRQVMFWPDNDDAGIAYIKKIAGFLHHQDPSMEMTAITPPKFKPGMDTDGQAILEPLETELAKGWDAADALAQGWTQEHIQLLPPEQYSQCRSADHQVQQQPATKDKLTKKEHVDNIVAMFDGYLQYINGEPYAYTEGHWPMLDERVEVELPIAHYMGKKVSKAAVNELLSLVQIFQARTEQAVAPDMNLICLLNGTLNTRNGELIPHSPDHNLKNQINCQWDPAAQCKRWLQFLDEIFVDDPDKAEKIQLLQEWFGYCMIPDNRQHKFLWLVGGGGNGKSVLLDILRLLVGLKYVSDAHIERLARPAVLAELENKLVNISSEMSAEATISDSNFKAIVAGDFIEAERKFKKPFSFKPTVRMIGATNHLPRLQDLSDGFFRRACWYALNIPQKT